MESMGPSFTVCAMGHVSWQCVRNSSSLSTRFNCHFNVSRYQNVAFLDFIASKNDGGGDDNWKYKTCKAPVKMSPPTNQHSVFLEAGCPSRRPTNSVRELKTNESQKFQFIVQKKRQLLTVGRQRPNNNTGGCICWRLHTLRHRPLQLIFLTHLTQLENIVGLVYRHIHTHRGHHSSYLAHLGYHGTCQRRRCSRLFCNPVGGRPVVTSLGYMYTHTYTHTPF